MSDLEKLCNALYVQSADGLESDSDDIYHRKTATVTIFGSCPRRPAWVNLKFNHFDKPRATFYDKASDLYMTVFAAKESATINMQEESDEWEMSGKHKHLLRRKFHVFNLDYDHNTGKCQRKIGLTCSQALEVLELLIGYGRLGHGPEAGMDALKILCIAAGVKMALDWDEWEYEWLPFFSSQKSVNSLVKAELKARENWKHKYLFLKKKERRRRERLEMFVTGQILSRYAKRQILSEKETDSESLTDSDESGYRSEEEDDSDESGSDEDQSENIGLIEGELLTFQPIFGISLEKRLNLKKEREDDFQDELYVADYPSSDENVDATNDDDSDENISEGGSDGQNNSDEDVSRELREACLHQ